MKTDINRKNITLNITADSEIQQQHMYGLKQLVVYVTLFRASQSI
jgi:hypothetical protein